MGFFFLSFFLDQCPSLLWETLKAFLSGEIISYVTHIGKLNNQASISVIFKKDKDSTLCGSYRPISLLNTDEKILAKVLACRMEAILSSVISDDQTGFIKSCHLFTNIRRLLNIIYSPTSLISPEVVISLDAEKAFDRVEWCYLFFALKQFGFGEKFISWIRLLYTSPQACVTTNNLQSQFPPIMGHKTGVPYVPFTFCDSYLTFIHCFES